jgi:hypothetical protein
MRGPQSALGIWLPSSGASRRIWLLGELGG